MIRSNGGKRISQMIENNEITGDALFTYVQDGVNYSITYTELLTLLGATGSMAQAGADTATPILDVDGSVNNIRGVENGPGIQAEITAENGLKLSMNYNVDVTGSPVMTDLLDEQPTIRSIVGGSGITVTTVGDTIEISLT
jgi:hypothetical protein